MHRVPNTSRRFYDRMVDDNLIWEYRADLERLAARLCRDPHDAEDVAQSTLLKALQARGDFRGEATVRTWLHRIATNECLMMRRRRRPDPVDVVDASDRGLIQVTDRVDTPEDLALVAETQGEVLAALSDLPQHHRTAVLLVDGCRMSYEEAARATDLTPAAIRSILYRARKVLRDRLEQAEAGT